VLEIPTRRYALAGRLLVRAIEEATSTASARDAAMRIAAEEGRRLGEECAHRRGSADVGAAVDLLSELGFEPLLDDSGGIVLVNCPFHALADAAPELGMNEALIQGLVDGLGVDGVEVLLAPGDGRCCVVLLPLGDSQGAAVVMPNEPCERRVGM
jgi:predicted ArsR family transcriptional regulator